MRYLEKKKIMVTGGDGQLGKALREVLAGEKVFFTNIDNMDITESKRVEKCFLGFKPEILIHGAALTDVDGCEENSKLAYKINTEGTLNLAEACEKHSCLMIYISTDYVFDGTKKEPYTEEDKPNPKSVYGKTKLEGEKAVETAPKFYILRTSWVFGEGNNFVRTMLNLSNKLDKIKIVNDQHGRPTYALDLAKVIYDIIKRMPEIGIYNVTGDGGIINWADFAKNIFKVAGKNTKVIPITTDEYLSSKKEKEIAPRPSFSALDLFKIKNLGIEIRFWPEAVKDYLNILKEEEICQKK